MSNTSCFIQDIYKLARESRVSNNKVYAEKQNSNVFSFSGTRQTVDEEKKLLELFDFTYKQLHETAKNKQVGVVFYISRQLDKPLAPNNSIITDAKRKCTRILTKGSATTKEQFPSPR